MRRRFLALAVAAALTLLCAACTPSGQAPVSTAPAVTLGEGSCGSFGGLAWGASYQELFPGEEVPSPAQREFQLDGWPCVANYEFDEDGLLWLGQYEFRPSQADVPAVLRAALEAMTEAYGEPQPAYTTTDDWETVPAPTVEDVEAGTADFCLYIWDGLDDGGVSHVNASLQLQGGVVYLGMYQSPVRESTTPAVTLGEGSCGSFGGLAWGASYQELFPGEEIPSPAQREFQLDGWPCVANYEFDEDGLLWSGHYIFSPEEEDIPAVYRAALAAMTAAYGEPDELYTPVDGERMPVPTIDDVETGRAETCMDLWGNLDDGQGGRVHAGLQIVNSGEIYLFAYQAPVRES